MACTGTYASLSDYTQFFCISDLDDVPEASIRLGLRKTAATIHASMAASDQCSCTLASWAAEMLQLMNIIMTALFHNCPCGNIQLSDEQTRAYMEWLNSQLVAIRTGELELCDGETSRDYPAFGWAEQNWDEGTAVQIIANSIARSLV